jgi:signal transduction histidine kinase
MVVIAPPYWQTWWFRALVAAALLGLVAFAYNIRVRHLLALERLRLRVASDLHDDLGGVLSSLALSSDLVRRTLPDEQATSKNRLLEMGSVARAAADALRSIVWVIDPGHETMDEMVMAMRTTATRMLRNMEVSFSAGPMPARRILDMEFRRNVALSFNEILNNILKHAHAGRVDINLRSEGDRLVLRVHDDGTGFDTSQISPGNGLGNLQHRAAAVGGTCTLTSEPGKGTTVEIEGKIP